MLKGILNVDVAHTLKSKVRPKCTVKMIEMTTLAERFLDNIYMLYTFISEQNYCWSPDTRHTNVFLQPASC